MAKRFRSQVKLEDLLSGKRCSPLTLTEFGGYLEHSEHSVENLRFYLWLQGYRDRYAKANPSRPAEKRTSSSSTSSSIATTSTTSAIDEKAAIEQITERNENLSNEPLPFAEEIGQVYETFFAVEAPLELNIDARLRTTLKKHLQLNAMCMPCGSTDPLIFKAIEKSVKEMLNNSLNNYLTYLRGNVNRPKQLFWYAVGTIDFTIGLLASLLCVFLVHSRWWRFFGLPFILFGAMQFYSAMQRWCQQVNGRAARQLFAWEYEASRRQSEENVGSPSDAYPPPSPASTTSGFAFTADTSKRASLTPTAETWSVHSGQKTPSPRPSTETKFPIFGPEKKIEDSVVLEMHRGVMRDILIVGGIVTVALGAVLLAIPQQK